MIVACRRPSGQQGLVRLETPAGRIRLAPLSAAVDIGTLGELRENVGGDAGFVAELIDEFLADAPVQLEALRAAAASGDAEAARRAAHTLKGNARTFGAPAFADLCREAEAAAAEGRLQAAGAALPTLEREWERVQAALTAFRDTGE